MTCASERDGNAKKAVWREIGRFFQRRYISATSRVLDVAADAGYFIRNIIAAERWASDLRDTSAHMPDGVRFVQSDDRHDHRAIRERHAIRYRSRRRPQRAAN